MIESTKGRPASDLNSSYTTSCTAVRFGCHAAHALQCRPAAPSGWICRGGVSQRSQRRGTLVDCGGLTTKWRKQPSWMKTAWKAPLAILAVGSRRIRQGYGLLGSFHCRVVQHGGTSLDLVCHPVTTLRAASKKAAPIKTEPRVVRGNHG
jgi:hypothetical protein